MSDAKQVAHEITGQVKEQLDQQRKAGTLVEHANFGRLLKPGASELTMKISESLHTGKARVGELMRAIKHDPESPPALLAQYIVHRANNVESFVPHKADKGDEFFLKNHHTSNNSHIKASDLHQLIEKNPQVIEGMLKHRDLLHGWIKRGVGLNIKKHEGQDYVALTRGLPDKYHDQDNALAPFSDKADSGYGNIQHSLWVPLKDVWFAYPAAPEWIRGELGHQNEYLVSNHGRRYLGKKEDVKSSRFYDAPPEYFSVDGKANKGITENLIAPLFDDFDNMKLSDWGKEYFASNPTRLKSKSVFNSLLQEANVPPILFKHQMCSRDIAKGAPYNQNGVVRNSEALANPNLTPEDLIALIQSTEVESDKTALAHVTSNPNYNEPVAIALLLKAQHHEDKLADTIGAILSHKAAPPRVADILMDGLLNGKPWATKAVYQISSGEGINPEMGDKILHSVLRAQNEQKEVWNGMDIAPLFKHIPLSEVTIKQLTESEKKEPLAGSIKFYDRAEGEIAPQEASRFLYNIASNDKKLSLTAAMQLANSRSGAKGLLQREHLDSVQQAALLDTYNPENYLALVEREDFQPNIAINMIEKLRENEPPENDYSARNKYLFNIQEIMSAFVNNPYILWQDMWNAVDNHQKHAPRMMQHFSKVAKWASPFDLSDGIFEGELLNAIVRKRLHERNLENVRLSEFPR